MPGAAETIANQRREIERLTAQLARMQEPQSFEPQTLPELHALHLITTGSCSLPLDWSDVAHRVGRDEGFADCLAAFNRGILMPLQALIQRSAIQLCEDFTV